MGTRLLIYFFLGLCDYSDKFPKTCSAVRAVGNALLFCHQCGQQLNLSIVTNYDLSQVSNKAASSVNKEKLLKEYFHRGYPYAAIVSLLEKRHGVRMHVRMLKSKLRIDLENRQVSFAGHRSQVIVLPIQKVPQTLVKANLRPN